MSSLYLHIPFCSSKCPYCDFFSQVGSQQQLDEYVDLLKLNIEIGSGGIQKETSLETIFFGGGTPSLLSAKQLEKILNQIDKNIGIKSDAEVTLEGNPGTLALEQLHGFRRAGINRLSLGIQSLNDQNLKLLGRIHTVAQARDSVLAARAAGFDNLNLDLMFALPNQDIPSLKSEISALLNFEPEHISLYGLSFEEGTEFSSRQQSGEIESCEEGLYADQYQLLDYYLTGAGYEHYEISNFARVGRDCRHNQVYWQRKSCLAIGAGAHGFLDQGWGQRWHVPAKLKRYKEFLLQGKDPSELLEIYDQNGAMKEYVYLALRTSTGINLQEFHKKFDLQFAQVFAAAIDKVKKYLQFNKDCCHFNAEGWLIYDHLISNFL
jgi:oxygen-independent coproporphyrinogen III oxidase